MTTLDARRGDVAAVVAAGGAGTRLGGDLPKALRLLAGESLLSHAVRRLTAAGSVGWLVVAAPAGHEDTVRGMFALASRITVVPGGQDRRRSVAAALAAVPAGFDIVLVHDAARPLTPPALVDQVAAAVRSGRDAVVPVLPVPDTISEIDQNGRVVGTPDRSTLRAVQTPQGFRRSVLAAAHAAPAAGPVTDDAGLVARLGVAVDTVPGSGYAMKITTRLDLWIASALLSNADPDPA